MMNARPLQSQAIGNSKPEQHKVTLQVTDLKVHFKVKSEGWRSKSRSLHAVDGVTFEIARGKTLGLVGESGCGKSTTALAVARLVDHSGGTIRLLGDDISHLEGRALRRYRRYMQPIFQDPFSSLNPRARAEDIIREPLDIIGLGTRAERTTRVSELLHEVGLKPEQGRLFPHQFSGGQRQRISVARALSTKPDLVICDEPVSALDVAVQAQILNLLIRIQTKHNLGYLFISHDLGVIQRVCDDVAVMYLGGFVEQAPSPALYRRPLHPYTHALMSAVPHVGQDKESAKRYLHLDGDVQSPIDLPEGCRFSRRCPFATEHCRTVTPALRVIDDEHRVACHMVTEEGRFLVSGDEFDDARAAWPERLVAER